MHVLGRSNPEQLHREGNQSTGTITARETFLQSVKEQPSFNTHGIVRRFGVSYSWRILNEEQLHSFSVVDEHEKQLMVRFPLVGIAFCIHLRSFPNPLPYCTVS